MTPIKLRFPCVIVFGNTIEFLVKPILSIQYLGFFHDIRTKLGDASVTPTFEPAWLAFRDGAGESEP